MPNNWGLIIPSPDNLPFALVTPFPGLILFPDGGTHPPAPFEWPIGFFKLKLFLEYTWDCFLLYADHCFEALRLRFFQESSHFHNLCVILSSWNTIKAGEVSLPLWVDRKGNGKSVQVTSTCSMLLLHHLRKKPSVTLIYKYLQTTLQFLMSNNGRSKK